MSDWPERKKNAHCCAEIITSPRCRRVLFHSQGLRDIGKRLLPDYLHSKLSVVYVGARDPFFGRSYRPRERAKEEFTLLTLTSRYWDKGVPQIIEVFRRVRYVNPKARLILVCSALPKDFTAPEGTEIFTFRITPAELKHRLYQCADVVITPVYSDGLLTPEASAYGIPTVTAKIHHGDEFIDGAKAGFAFEPPIWAYGNAFDRVHDWWEFERELIELNRNGGFDDLVANMTGAVIRLMDERDLYSRMSGAARAFFEREFDLEIRNKRLRDLYREVLHEPGIN